MKNYLPTIVLLLLSISSFAQKDHKASFQKSRYELAVSYYKKADFKNAIDLFSIAGKILPDNELGKESIKKVDTLKIMLRKDILKSMLGIWKMKGDKPIWSVDAANNSKNITTEECIEINPNQILFYELDKKTFVKKLIKTENLVFYNKDQSDALFSAIILSDGSIWDFSVNEKTNVLHMINIAKQTTDGFEKIATNNMERFYTRE